jgi:hypothetical protein
MRTILVLLSLSIFSEASAQGRACPPYSRPVKLNFVTDNVPTVYNNNYNVTGIQTIMRRRGHVIAGMHQRALGITSSEIALSIQAQTVADPWNGGYCVYLRAVDVQFGYRSMEVYIASEYKPQSCEYRVILDHENQHVAINRGGIREYAPRLRQELERQLGLLKPRFTADAQTSADRKLNDLHDAVGPLLDGMERALSQRNAAIDSAVNYAAIADMCKNWDQGNVWPPVTPGRTQTQ